MLTALLLYIIARVRKNRLFRKNLFLILTLINPGFLLAQGIQYNYDIIRNGKKTGHVIIQQTKNGSRETIDLEAFIKSSLVIGIRIKSEEKILIENGMIVRSSFSRTINNRTPVNRVIKFAGDHYIVQSAGSHKKIHTARIDHNMATLYLNEPASLQTIYSDASEKFLELQKLSEGIYQVLLPDGGKNIYHFENRICRKIEVKQKLFTAEILLRSINQL